MGSSDKAGNRGKPATPRDGSAIELVALSKVAASWLASLYQRKVYPYSGITRTNSDGKCACVIDIFTFTRFFF